MAEATNTGPAMALEEQVAEEEVNLTLLEAVLRLIMAQLVLQVRVVETVVQTLAEGLVEMSIVPVAV